MKKLLFVLLGIMIAVSGWSFDVSEIDLTKIDSSDASVLPTLPDPLYIRGIGYAGDEYTLSVKKQALDIGTLLSRIDVKKLDASDAKVKLIGPDKVYVGGIGYDGTDYAVVGVLNDKNELSILEYYVEDENVMAGWDDIDTSQATLVLSKSIGANYYDTLTVGNIIVGGKTAVVGLKVDLANVSASLSAPVFTGKAPLSNDAKALAEEVISLKKQLEERRKELSAALRKATSMENKFEREAEIGKKNRQEAFTLNRKYGQALESIDELTAKVAGMEKYVKELEAALATAQSAPASPIIDRIIANLKASKIDLTGTYVIADSDEVTAKNVVYDGDSYDVVLYYDDAAQDAKITKIIDKNGSNILAKPFNFGWGQYRVGAVGYLTLRAALEATTNAVKTATEKVVDAEKRATYAEKKAETAEKALKSMAGTVTAVRGLAQYNKVVKSGFSGVSKKMGTWPAPAATLTQTDTNQYFAKYVIPVKQVEGEILYSVAVKGAAGDVKQGGGLHFLASGAEKADGYAFGDSYLVWVTKDPKHSPYSSSKTYVQLYQSVGGTQMINLASIALTEKDDISKGVLVQALYKEGSITIYVNGEEKFTLPKGDGTIIKGDAIALRTMVGPITFSEFSIKTK